MTSLLHVGIPNRFWARLSPPTWKGSKQKTGPLHWASSPTGFESGSIDMDKWSCISGGPADLGVAWHRWPVLSLDRASKEESKRNLPLVWEGTVLGVCPPLGSHAGTQRLRRENQAWAWGLLLSSGFYQSH